VTHYREKAAFEPVRLLGQTAPFQGLSVQPYASQGCRQLADDIGTGLQMAGIEGHKAGWLILDVEGQ